MTVTSWTGSTGSPLSTVTFYYPLAAAQVRPNCSDHPMKRFQHMDLVVHVSWSADTFFVWGESSEMAPPRRGRKPRIPLHPLHASPDSLRTVIRGPVPSIEWESIYTTEWTERIPRRRMYVPVSKRTQKDQGTNYPL
jgi:hypothetical protein